MNSPRVKAAMRAAADQLLRLGQAELRRQIEDQVEDPLAGLLIESGMFEGYAELATRLGEAKPSNVADFLECDSTSSYLVALGQGTSDFVVATGAVSDLAVNMQTAGVTLQKWPTWIDVATAVDPHVTPTYVGASALGSSLTLNPGALGNIWKANILMDLVTSQPSTPLFSLPYETLSPTTSRRVRRAAKSVEPDEEEWAAA